MELQGLECSSAVIPEGLGECALSDSFRLDGCSLFVHFEARIVVYIAGKIEFHVRCHVHSISMEINGALLLASAAS